MSRGQGQSVLHRLRWLAGAGAGEAGEDAQLLERFAGQGDEQAFAAMLGRHGPMVLGACRRILGQVQDAEDVFQATFLILARKAASIRRGEALAGWLYQVASNLALKARARRGRRQESERQVQAMRPGDRSPLAPREAPLAEREDYDRAEVRQLLDEELRGLAARDRDLLVLCYLEGLSQREAARALGWPEGSMAWRLEQARERLRQRLLRRGLAAPAAGFAVLLSQQGAAAAVPAAVLQSTLSAALAFAGKGAAAGLCSAEVAALVKGGLLNMWLNELRRIGVMVLAGGLCLGGAGWLAYQYAGADTSPDRFRDLTALAGPQESTLPAQLAQIIDFPGIDINTPMKDGFEFISDRYGLKIVIDDEAFEPIGVQKAEEQPVILPPLRKVELGTVLQLMAQQIKGDVKVGVIRWEGNRVLVVPGEPPVRAAAAPATALAGKLKRPIDPPGGLPAEPTLWEVLTALGKEHDLTILIDHDAWYRVEVNRVDEEPVKLPAQKQVALNQVLEMLAKQVKGSVLVQRDVVWIVPAAK